MAVDKIPERPVLHEAIKIGDTLPTEYQTVLGQLRPDVPPIFKEKAIESAYFFWSLETSRKLLDKDGKSLDDKVALFVDELITTRVVVGTYVRASSDFSHTNAPDPEVALPKWATDRRKQKIEDHKKKGETKTLTDSDREEIRKFYEEYAERYGTKIEEKGQVYYQYKEGITEPDESLFGNFKFYIEHQEQTKFAQIRQALDDFRMKGVHPNLTKFYDNNRLVLYWNHKPDNELSDQIREIFLKNGIEVRGPGQDSSEVIINDNGTTNLNVDLSNDSSLGTKNPFIWKEAVYNPTSFFKQYLSATYYGRRDPTEPYRVTFIPIRVDNPNKHAGLIAGLTEQIKRTDGLDICVSGTSRYIEAF